MYHLFWFKYSMGSEGSIQSNINYILTLSHRVKFCITPWLYQSVIHELGAEVALDILCIYSEEEVIWFSDMLLYMLPKGYNLSLIVPIWTQYDDCIVCPEYLPEWYIAHPMGKGMYASSFSEIWYRMCHNPIDKNSWHMPKITSKYHISFLYFLSYIPHISAIEKVGTWVEWYLWEVVCDVGAESLIPRIFAWKVFDWSWYIICVHSFGDIEL